MNKKVGLLEAISVGVGGMVGGGIFAVLGLAVANASGATPLAFLIAGIIAIITAYSYAKLAETIKSKGGTSSYINEAFGKNVFTGGANNFLWINYIVMLALYASAFGSYAPNLLPLFRNQNIDYHIYASAIIMIAISVNYLSVKMVSEVEKWAVIFKVVILTLFVAVGVYGLFSSSFVTQLTLASWPSSSLSIIAGGMLIFVAYEGFELISSVTPDIDKQANIKKAFLFSTLFVILLYILIAIITVGSLPFSTIATAEDYVLAEAAKPVLGKLGFIMIVIAALISTFSAINATLYSSSRINYELATDDELPHEFTIIIKNEPIGVIITGVLALLMVNLIRLQSISGIGSIGFLMIFALINYSAFRLRSRIGGKTYLFIGGMALNIIAIVTLVIRELQNSPITIIYSVSLLIICFLIEFAYKKSEYHFQEKLVVKPSSRKKR